jgi:hypothetical protein
MRLSQLSLMHTNQNKDFGIVDKVEHKTKVSKKKVKTIELTALLTA